MSAPSPADAGDAAPPVPADASPLAAAFAHAVPAQAPPASYLIGVAAVAVVMLLLPAVYLAVVAAVAMLTILWAIHGTVVFGGSGIVYPAILYLVPLFAGATAVVFLLKPLLARRPAPPRPRSVSRDEEPMLHEFAGRIAAAVGAPAPARIDVTLDVNASASFARGFGSFLRRDDLALTIGLPLAAGLTAEELASVLAHEFGHFAQGAGMRLSYLIRTESEWLVRIAYERDSWDVRLAHVSRIGGLYGRAFGGSARGLVWAVRKLLTGLAAAGHAVSSRMSREMEFDADRRSYRLTGTDAFEAAQRRIRRLSAATQLVQATMRDAWLSRGRVADYPALTVAKCELMSDEVRAAVDEQSLSQTTHAFASHPCDRERLDRARSGGGAATLRVGLPASALFADLGRLCVDVTYAAHDQTVHTRPLSVAEATSLERERSEERAAVRRFLQDLSSLARPLFPGFVEVAAPASIESARDEISGARDLLLRRLSDYGAAMKKIEDARRRRLLADAAATYLKAGVKIKYATFGLRAASVSAAEDARAAARKDAESAAGDVLDVECACTRRVALALGLLTDASVAARVEDATVLRDDAAHALLALAALERAWPDLVALADSRDLLGNLAASTFGTQFAMSMAAGVEGIAARILQMVAVLRRRLDTPCPLPSADRRTIGVYAVDPPAPDHGGGPVVAANRAAVDALMRLFDLHQRLQGRLCIAAERVERALGLDPLPDPATRAPAEAPPAAPRTSHF
jgi:Zn-dependent protease with chaperone function